MNKLVLLLACLSTTACAKFTTNKPASNATPFKSWYCKFESVTPGMGPEYLFIDLRHMEFNKTAVFLEDVCMLQPISPTENMIQCQTLAITATFGSDGYLTAQPDPTQPPTASAAYTYTEHSLRVTTPADPAWGDLVCED